MAEHNPAELHTPVGLRAADGNHDRHRRWPNSRRPPWPDRRRGERRKQRFHALLFAAAALSATPPQITARSLLPLEPFEMSGFGPIHSGGPFEILIQEAADTHDIDADLIRAVVETESEFDPTVVSPAGAKGLMQLTPAVAREMGVVDALDPRDNIMGGAKYLKQLLDANRGSVPLALASYNAGLGNVRRYKGIPPFKETRNYVRKITDMLDESH
ncbi:MAG: lytic transglycosylase domain-containing protein [Vicinamibacterales bacterium]